VSELAVQNDHEASDPVTRGFGLMLGGCALQAVTAANAILYQPGSILWSMLTIACTIALVLGGRRYVQSRGHDPLWGLLGVCNLLGLAMMVILPDFLDDSKTERKGFQVIRHPPPVPMPVMPMVSPKGEERSVVRIQVKLFAILRERAGASDVALDLPPDAHVADAANALTQQFPSLAPFIKRVAFAVNQSYAKWDTQLNDGDELAVIPPVSGGADSPADWIELFDTPLDAGAAVEFVRAPQAGGIDVFLGTTRAEINADARRLVALDYEAYSEMALKQMRDLALRARERWPVIKLAILHRVGRVEVTAPSVVIAVSTPHRAESFEACRWIIDTLKQDVPIWKREVWDDGSGSWVHPS
jgi:molybdopterin synthase catalytic subunit